MVEVTVVTTPADGSCGIGTYTAELLDEMPEDVAIDQVVIPSGSTNPLPYLVGALRAGLQADRVVHVQHEYGVFGPKSISSWLFFLTLHFLGRLRGLTIVLTLHSGWNARTIGPPLVPIKRVYVNINNRLLVATADHVIFLSENVQKKFTDSVTPTSYETLPHGVQTTTLDIGVEEAREMLGVNTEATTVVQPGYVKPQKGTDVFAAVARCFHDKGSDAQFVIAGGGQSDSDYFTEIVADAPPNLTITGRLEERRFHAAFVAADLVVLPYRTVDQSGVLNWCAAYEVPVVATRLRYFEQLHDQWGNVALVDIDDPAATAATVRRLLNNQEHRAALRAAMADYREARSVATVAERHAEVYRRIQRHASPQPTDGGSMDTDDG